MVTIKKISRKYERVTNEYTGASWISYPDAEQDFIKDIENLCNTIGENNLISVQFLNGERNEIHCCIITYILRKVRPSTNDSPNYSPDTPIPSFPADEYKKYQELLDSGIITQEEFNAKKMQLLGLGEIV